MYISVSFSVNPIVFSIFSSLFFSTLAVSLMKVILNASIQSFAVVLFNIFRKLNSFWKNLIWIFGLGLKLSITVKEFGES
jgi:hypothetical protein